MKLQKCDLHDRNLRGASCSCVPSSNQRLRTLRKTVEHFARSFQQDGGASSETVKELFEAAAVLESLEKSPSETTAELSILQRVRDRARSLSRITCSGCTEWEHPICWIASQLDSALKEMQPVEPSPERSSSFREVAVKQVLAAIEAWNKQDGRMCNHDYDLMNDARQELQWILEDHQRAVRHENGSAD